MTFWDPDESTFYARCVDRFLLSAERPPTQIVELGTGDATAMVRMLRRRPLAGTIRGYEIHPPSFARATKRIERAGLVRRYRVVQRSLFAAPHRPRLGHALIANPPYLPAPRASLIMPELWGGPDGTRVVKQLIDLDFRRMMILVASVADPIGVIRYARRAGYSVEDFAVLTLPFGGYTRDPIVAAQIRRLAARQKALVRRSSYQVAAVLFAKRDNTPDQSQALVERMARWARVPRIRV